MPLIFVEPDTARIFFANAAANRMAGGSLALPQSGEDYLRLFDVRDLDDRPLRIDEMPAVRAARGELVSGQQIRWYTPAGPKVITVHGARIPAMLGHPETVLIAFDDITALKDAQAQLEEAVRVRQDFLSIAGHELKTPLTSVLLNLRAVDKSLRAGARGDDDPRLFARWGALSRRSAASRGWSISCSMFRASPPARWCCSPAHRSGRAGARGGGSLRAACQQSGTINVQVARGWGSKGWWDRLRLEQILTNLLSNAVKYGAGRPISVEIGVTGPADDAEVWIAVRDRGIGMSPTISSASSAASSAPSSAHNYGGLGLGLWIVRQVVEAMGGSISAESEPDRGSTFTLRLPRRTAPRS